jgi:hypothetical protein
MMDFVRRQVRWGEKDAFKILTSRWSCVDRLALAILGQSEVGDEGDVTVTGEEALSIIGAVPRAPIHLH